jgi:hypothetical protein
LFIRFRREVLRSLRKAERLRPETEQMLLGWHHFGFSVHTAEPVLPDDTDRLEHLARYITRASMRLDAISRAEGGRMKVRTPPASQTGKTSMDLDPLDLIHRICAQIPAPRQHLVRYYGWYGNRARGARKEHGIDIQMPDRVDEGVVLRGQAHERVFQVIAIDVAHSAVEAGRPGVSGGEAAKPKYKIESDGTGQVAIPDPENLGGACGRAAAIRKEIGATSCSSVVLIIRDRPWPESSSPYRQMVSCA